MFCTKDSFKIFEGCFHSFIAAGLNVTQEKILTPPHTRESCLISYKGMNFVCLCDRNKKKGGRLNSLYPFDIFFAKKHTSCYYFTKVQHQGKVYMPHITSRGNSNICQYRRQSIFKTSSKMYVMDDLSTLPILRNIQQRFLGHKTCRNILLGTIKLIFKLLLKVQWSQNLPNQERCRDAANINRPPQL